MFGTHYILLLSRNPTRYRYECIIVCYKVLQRSRCGSSLFIILRLISIISMNTKLLISANDSFFLDNKLKKTMIAWLSSIEKGNIKWFHNNMNKCHTLDPSTTRCSIFLLTLFYSKGNSTIECKRFWCDSDLLSNSEYLSFTFWRCREHFSKTFFFSL